ncbi:MAG: hypothetical protein QM736_17780 [Vicinamibacterales bacterium]
MNARKAWKLALGMVTAGAAVTMAVAPSLRAQAPTTADITYTKDIAPILQRSCENCHRPNGAGPMPLTNYDEVRPWARSIKARTGIGPHAGVMPPWYMEKNIGIQKYQGRSVVERRGDREDREVGRRRRAARQSGRHASVAQVGRLERVAYRHARSRRPQQGHRRQGELA